MMIGGTSDCSIISATIRQAIFEILHLHLVALKIKLFRDGLPQRFTVVARIGFDAAIRTDQ